MISWSMAKSSLLSTRAAYHRVESRWHWIFVVSVIKDKRNSDGLRKEGRKLALLKPTLISFPVRQASVGRTFVADRHRRFR